MAEPTRSDVKPESDVYTALVVVATLFLIAGVAFVSVRAQALFGSWMPF